MLLRILLYGFLAYLVYKIIFEFIIPVYKTTKQVRKGFQEMSKRMNEYAKTQQQYNADPKTSPQKPSSNLTSDYIDFEEIK